MNEFKNTTPACGNCDHWMKKSSCPHEATGKPTCSGSICDSYHPTSEHMALAKRQQIEALQPCKKCGQSFTRLRPSHVLCAKCVVAVIMSPDLYPPSKPKTQPWGLEGLDIRQTGRDGDPDCWVITAGGGQQPGYRIVRGDLESAVLELVRQVTEDAISDEAREWQNDCALIP